MILVLRTMLARENARREKEERDETYDDVYIQREKEDGSKVEQRVDKVSSGCHVLRVLFKVWNADILRSRRSSWTLRISKIGISGTSCKLRVYRSRHHS